MIVNDEFTYTVAIDIMLSVTLNHISLMNVDVKSIGQTRNK